ncbi:MAG: hypothetical protein CL613_06435 [Aquimarina sp.]|nr:hypothetical protein [Aquimarina sp.]
MKFINYSFFILLTLFVLSCDSVDQDMNHLCDVAKDIVTDTSINKEEKQFRFVQNINIESLSHSTKQFIHNLANQKNNPTYADFTNHAEKNGLPDWECESIELLFKKE